MRHAESDPKWKGHPRDYQLAAQRAYVLDRRKPILPWSWVTTSCDLPMCLTTKCMTIHAPTVIKYPAGVCCYCGEVSGTKDHLLPEPATGPTLRLLVAVVPACADCNSRIADYSSPSVTDRRARAHQSIAKRYARILAVPDKGPAELASLGHGLRSVAIKNNNLRRQARLRLSWPDDPFYDLRAFQKSGIPDPVAIGLIGDYLRRTA